MRVIFIGILSFFHVNSTLAQELDGQEIVLWSPIVWGPMVYVPAGEITHNFVVRILKEKSTEIGVDCENAKKFKWLCEGELPVVFEGLSGEGEVMAEVFLCEPGSVDEGKQFYSEKYLAFNCGLVGGWSENYEEPYIEEYEDT
ncbi:MAG: hypothetical protein AAF431_08420 [Pseudomonadota bacterium]